MLPRIWWRCAPSAHLVLLHQGRIHLEHADGKLRWVIGRAEGLTVLGRELVAERGESVNEEK